jgi:hypothetical protein
MCCYVWRAHVCVYVTLSELQSGAHPLSTANFQPPAWRRSAQPANSHLAGAETHMQQQQPSIAMAADATAGDKMGRKNKPYLCRNSGNPYVA